MKGLELASRPSHAVTNRTAPPESLNASPSMKCAVTMAVASLYLGWRSRDVRKFLAGAFFVSSHTLLSLPRRCFGTVHRHGLCRNTVLASSANQKRKHLRCKPLA